MIGYGCCVGSWDRLGRYVAPSVAGRPLLGLSGQDSIARAYNEILDLYAGSDLAVALVHDDLEILDPIAAAEDRFLAALAEPEVVLAGVAGARDVRSLAWWEADTVGHQHTDERLIDFGPREGYVDALEGSVLVFSPWAVERLRFDVAYPGFHGYDEIVMAARRSGMRAAVVNVATHHHTRLGFKSEASAQQWHEADRRYREKWGL